ncbi:hypothetical protein [Georgenia sp. MJ170]|uniref:hypothetical protein n=1 Tax=Georgenia sunbinii TaxID=3117728 RepID=UPI002F263A66
MSDDERSDDTRADEAVERLRASDPAGSAEPDAGRLEQLTTERRGDELAARRDRQPRRWASVAAVAAGALVVGGTGFGIGAVTAGSDEDDRDVVATAGYEGADSTGPGVAQPEPFAADNEATRSMASPMMLSMGADRMTFTAVGLSDDTGTAGAWAFDGPAAYRAETAARAAEVLGVPGEPADRHGSWRVGEDDGSGPSLEVGSDGAVSMHYTDPDLYPLMDVGPVEPMPLPAPEGAASNGARGTAEAPDAPVDDGDDAAGAGAADSPTTVAPDIDDDTATSDADALAGVEPGSPGMVAPAEPEPEPVAPADLADEAAVLHGVLAELGVDADSAEYVSRPFGTGGDIVSVSAYQLLDGRRTGYEWDAAIVDDRIYTFSGPLAPLADLGEYDVVSPVEAVQRLGDPRFGGAPVWTDGMEIMPHVEEPSGWTWGDPPGAPPAAGAALPWAVTDVDIVAAHPALIQQSTDTGSILLLPAYELSDADGRTWSVLAVADHELAF